jgi:hypothetical protein
MAFTVNHLTHVISVPQADLDLISGTLYEHDTDDFRKALKAWEAGEEGIVEDDTHQHFTTYTIAGVTYARAINILSPYSITYEDAQYSVQLVGSNNNMWDIGGGILNQNQVQVIPGNSAGLIQVTSGSGLSAAEQAKLDDLHKIQGLDSGNPMTVTPTSRAAGSIQQTISGDGETTSTVTRTA